MNNWVKLGFYIKNLVLRGITDEEKIVVLAMRYANSLFFNEERDMDVERAKKLRREILIHIRKCIMQLKEEMRKAGEDYQKVTLEVVSKRLLGLE